MPEPAKKGHPSERSLWFRLAWPGSSNDCTSRWIKTVDRALMVVGEGIEIVCHASVRCRLRAWPLIT